MTETMTVKELKEALKDVPDDYLVRTRPENAALHRDEMPWQLNFAGVISEVKVVDAHNIVMLIRGYE